MTLGCWREQLSFDDALVADIASRNGRLARIDALIDAALVEAQAGRPSHAAGQAARSEVDPDADCTRKHGRSTFGGKMHVGVDQGSGVIRRAVLTPAKTAESEVADALIRAIPAAVERVFGTLKRVHGSTRVRGYSLAINRVQMLLLATAYNLRRADRLIHGPT